MTTKSQEFSALLDRLMNANVRFVKTAKRFCDRRGNRSADKQKALRQQLDASIDVLIQIYVECEASIDALAQPSSPPIAFSAAPDDRARQDDLDLFRRAKCIADIVADDLDVLADIARPDRQH